MAASTVVIPTTWVAGQYGSLPPNSELYVLHGTERNKLTVISDSCCDLGQALLILLNYSFLSLNSLFGDE